MYNEEKTAGKSHGETFVGFLVGCESFSESPWPEIYVPEIKDVSVQTERKERGGTTAQQQQQGDIEEEEEEETQVLGVPPSHISLVWAGCWGMGVIIVRLLFGYICLNWIHFFHLKGIVSREGVSTVATGG
jgi:hypothetical protein